jgi:hypothetical protein
MFVLIAGAKCFFTLYDAQAPNPAAGAFTDAGIWINFAAAPPFQTPSRDYLMNPSIISALAALVGAAIGGLTSVLASWLNQQTQAKAQWIAQDRIGRQELYREFIEEASKAYADALQHDKPDIPLLVGIYAKMSRMRVLSSPKVVESAERVGRKIIDAYLAPDKDFLALRDMVNSGTIDLLGQFSDACREEFDWLRRQF